jgi:hypothetical protein
MLRILETIHVGSETGSGPETSEKVGSGLGKNHSGSTTLMFCEKRGNLCLVDSPLSLSVDSGLCSLDGEREAKNIEKIFFFF